MPDINSDSFTFSLPNSIYMAAHEQMSRTNPDDHQVLMLAAIIGNEFNIPLLVKASGLRTEQVICAIENLETARLIESINGAYRKGVDYQFVHFKIREALLLEISPARKCMLHSRVAHSMADLPGINSLENMKAIAQHYEAAGELESAFCCWFTVAKQSQIHPVGQDTCAAYQKAEVLIPHINLPKEQIREFYISWLEYARKSGEANLVTRLDKLLIDTT